MCYHLLKTGKPGSPDGDRGNEGNQRPALLSHGAQILLCKMMSLFTVRNLGYFLWFLQHLLLTFQALYRGKLNNRFSFPVLSFPWFSKQTLLWPGPPTQTALGLLSPSQCSCRSVEWTGRWGPASNTCNKSERPLYSTSQAALRRHSPSQVC